MLAADEELANEVSKLANRRSFTIYQTVNEILGEALEAEDLGYSLGELVENRRSLDKAGSMGLGLTFDGLFNDLIDLCREGSGEAWWEACEERGRWYGKYFRGKEDSLKCFFRGLGVFGS